MQVLEEGAEYRILKMQMTTKFTKIECKDCKTISGNPHHVNDKYCPHCDKYHKG